MAKFRVTTTHNTFTVECEGMALTEQGGRFGGNSVENFEFYDVELRGGARVIKASVSSACFVSAVHEV